MYYYIYSFLSVYRFRLRRYEKKMNIPKACPIFLKKPAGQPSSCSKASFKSTQKRAAPCGDSPLFVFSA